MSHSNNIARNSRKAAEEVRDEAQSMIDTVQERASNIAHNVQQMGADAATAVKEQVQQVRDTAVGYYEDGRDRAVQLEKRLEKRVKQHPMNSVLIAIGAGFLLGMLFRRR
jgi:ElaB/YqjD/DUF883 family membrane-anchored ribosome-binding protein